MAKRSKRDQQGADKPPPSETRYRVTRYGDSRNFAVYEGEDLLVVALYRKGAEAITMQLEAKDHKIAELQNQLAAIQQTPVSPAPPPAEPVKVWRPPQQLPLLTTTELHTPSRTTSRRYKSTYPPRRS